MGIQGFFTYLEKNCKTAITEIKPWDKVDEQVENQEEEFQEEEEEEPKQGIIPWQSNKNIPNFDVIMFDFQSIIYTVFNTYSQINDLMVLLNTIKTGSDYSKYDHPAQFIPGSGLSQAYNDIDNKIKQCIQSLQIFWKKLYDELHFDLYLDLDELEKYNLKICTNLFKKLNEKCSDIKFIEEVLIEDVFYKILYLICEYKQIPYSDIFNEMDMLDNMNKNDFNSGVYIYFDGIPSVSKIKEQLQRRIKDDIDSHINKNIKTITGLNDTPLYSNFIKMPQVGHNTEIVKKLKAKFEEINIYCNNIENEPDEAEHQIMRDIFKYKEQLKDKNIIIVSPDADLIILGLIQNAKYNLNIYIHKLEAIYKGYYKFDEPKNNQQTFILEYYTSIKNLREYEFFNINGQKINNQQLLDLCFILLLIGDDFLPAMNTISQAKVLPELIKIFADIIKMNSNFKIIEQCGDKYILNQYNFIRYIKELQKEEVRIYNTIIYIKDSGKPDLQIYDLDYKNWNNSNSRSEFETKLYDNYIYTADNKNPLQKYLYYKLALDKNIFLKNNNKYNLLKGKRNFVELDTLYTLYKKQADKEKDDDMITNYLEGCKFIFDLYLNNEIKDYYWYYKYERTPILKNILQYTKENRNIFKKFTFNYKNKVFTEEQYKSFYEYNKKVILINIMNNIIQNSKGDLITKVDSITDYKKITRVGQIYKQEGNKTYTAQNINYNILDTELAKLKDIYLIYSNIPIIYNCFNKKYLNKCLDINTELLDFSKMGQNGGYKNKYLKYKSKYLKLKQSLY